MLLQSLSNGTSEIQLVSVIPSVKNPPVEINLFYEWNVRIQTPCGESKSNWSFTEDWNGSVTCIGDGASDGFSHTVKALLCKDGLSS